MGWLAAQGAFLFIGLALGFVFMVIGLFIGHIIVFDSIALGILSGVACNYFFTLHPALCLLAGAAAFALLRLCLFLVFIKLFENRRLFLRLFVLLGFYGLGKVNKGNGLARVYLCFKLGNGGHWRVIDKPVKAVIVLLYGVLDVL
mgnify:CR=1 FL=1